ncbi:hypothetical protein [Sphingomonas sp. PR090111-T3T-6A]|uniref:hypothetical protein n=1 Tax=Sphingomonas sp. PR090111-T3T-6A TaxID=685778 RepID=UPI00037FA680|nr:hypothetical protein [Sphingomonas sp. PR090111-T3T-6A]
MSFVEDHERRASRRRVAAPGCGVYAVVAIIVIGISTIAFTLGDCWEPHCHDATDRTFGRIVLAVGVIGVALGVLLTWWASRSPDRD